MQSFQVNFPAPTASPGPGILVYEGTADAIVRGNGLGLAGIVVIVIVVAIAAFGCVFGTSIMRKRQRERSMFKTTDEADYDEADYYDDPDPPFIDVFKNLKSHNYDPENTYTINVATMATCQKLLLKLDLSPFIQDRIICNL